MGVLIPIKHGALHFGADLATVAAALYAANARRDGVTVPPLTQIAAAPPVPAQVNANRWCVVCPDCGGAEYVFLETPLYLCNSCWNAGAGGGWRRVRLPAAAQWAGVVDALGARPLPMDRNWNPDAGETVATLRAENAAHALPASPDWGPGGRPAYPGAGAGG